MIPNCYDEVIMSTMTLTLNETIGHDFDHMRQKARWQALRAQFTGESTELLDYDEVVDLLGVRAVDEPFTAEIPLDQIQGSVGRAKEFTKQFYPRNSGSRERWIGVKTAVVNLHGLHPIDVFQIDDVYFVQDGNHRVSVARQLGVETITARVTRVHTVRQFADLYGTDNCLADHGHVLARVRHWLRPGRQVCPTPVACEMPR